MARRQKTSPLEDLITLASKLPWWVSILATLISYVILHSIAGRPPITMTGPGQMGALVSRQLVTTLAMFGQYVLPFAFGLGAIVSGINAAKQRKLYESVKARSDVGSLNEMSWEDFEGLVGEHFRRNGFAVAREGGNGPDGGVDLVLRRGGEKHLVQCKQWKAYKVGVQPVREFYGVMSASGAAGGYFVTSGIFTDDAQKFVQGLNLELIDGRKLKAMIGPSAKGSAPFTPHQRKEPIPFAPRPQAPSLSAAPACPKCSSEMKKRTVRQGANAGKEFWGCSTFPKCNGTRLIEDHAAQAPTPAAPAADVNAVPRTCPHCGTELVLKRFHSGPKEGQEFFGCVPCRKGWPVG